MVPQNRILAALLLALLPAAAHASHHDGGGTDRVSMFSNITVTEDEPAGDIACIFCSVNLNGDVHGDVAVLFGTVNGSPDRTISGDVAILFSSLHLGPDSHIRGDLATAFSTADIPSSATVGGDRAIFSTGFGLTVLLAPLLLLAGIIWLIAHLLRENRARYTPHPQAPRRF